MPKGSFYCSLIIVHLELQKLIKVLVSALAVQQYVDCIHVNPESSALPKILTNLPHLEAHLLSQYLVLSPPSPFSLSTILYVFEVSI